MAYCTRDNLVQRFGATEIDDLLDRDNNSSDDTDTLAQTIADADALIDGYVSSQYAAPLSPVPQIIRYLSCDITRFMLWDDSAPDEVRQRYNDAIARLKDISKGIMTLPDSTPKPENNPSGVVDYVAKKRVFTRESLCGF